MHKIKILTIALLLMLGLGACTHNNGDIGDFFGTWKLSEITIDGTNDSDYQGDVFWKFQASLIQMLTVDDSTHDYSVSMGSWSQPLDNILRLDFTHTDTDHPEPGSSAYSPQPGLHLPSACVFDMDIISLSSGKMVLRYTDTAGAQPVVYQYTFKKWN